MLFACRFLRRLVALGGVLLLPNVGCGSSSSSGVGPGAPGSLSGSTAGSGAPSSTGSTGSSAEDGSAPSPAADATVDGTTGASDDAGSPAGPDASGDDTGGGAPPDVVIPVPANHRVDFNFNVGWKFLKMDVTGAEAPAFDDSAWANVSTPHTYNDVDTYTHLGPGMVNGEIGQYTGVGWYRKHFTVPAEFADRKIFIEFQSVRQRGTVFINGTKLGFSETGFVPFGFDLTSNIKFGQDNVLAVQCDNTFPMNATGSSDPLAWHDPHWHPNFGGITSDVYLHVMDKLYVTLPLVTNLQTSGIYVHADNVSNASAAITVEAQIKNEYAAPKSVTITATVLDDSAATVLTLHDTQMIAPGQSVVSKPTAMLANPKLWSPESPNLYTVQVALNADGQTADVATVPLGVRFYKFSAANGITLNGQPYKLHGWGQKPTNSWAGLGAAVPDWMQDFSMRMMRQAGGNFVRWGHCAGSAANIRASDKYGLIVLQPGVEAEEATAGANAAANGNTVGAAWMVRVEAFRAVITYFRNNPSIFIWEGGNKAANTAPADIQVVRTIKDMLDPTRVFTMRVATNAPDLHFFDVLESTLGAEYTAGLGLGVFEGEYDRFESPRRVWDPLTPPYVGWTNPAGPQDWATAQDAESSVVDEVAEWDGFLKNTGHAGGANWHFTDEPTHRRVFTDVARDSGEVDAVRLPKESYYAVQAMWSNTPQVYLVGHWSYKAGQTKTVNVVSNCPSVELFVNGVSVGKSSSPTNGFLFSFPNVAWQQGTIKAVGTKGGVTVTSQKSTAGAPDHLKLTSTTGPDGWRADGADIAMIDVEVVDKLGVRVPTDQARVDFTTSGTEGVWRGGYNSGVANSTNNTYLNTEAGINRVFVRSTTKPGAFSVTATRAGLMPATVMLTSVPFALTGGLSTEMPARLSP
jgi:beta-galactosidase